MVKLVLGISILLILFIVVVTAYLSALTTSRDAQRVSDMTQISKALKFYYEQYGQYPSAGNGQAVGENETFSRFISSWPKAPQGGQCSKQNGAYHYEQLSDGDRYEIKFCLEKNYSGIPAGIRVLTPEGVR
jgi:hypothetical protein